MLGFTKMISSRSTKSKTDNRPSGLTPVPPAEGGTPLGRTTDSPSSRQSGDSNVVFGMATSNVLLSFHPNKFKALLNDHGGHRDDMIQEVQALCRDTERCKDVHAAAKIDMKELTQIIQENKQDPRAIQHKDKWKKAVKDFKELDKDFKSFAKDYNELEILEEAEVEKNELPDIEKIRKLAEKRAKLEKELKRIIDIHYVVNKDVMMLERTKSTIAVLKDKVLENVGIAPVKIIVEEGQESGRAVSKIRGSENITMDSDWTGADKEVVSLLENVTHCGLEYIKVVLEHEMAKDVVFCKWIEKEADADHEVSPDMMAFVAKIAEPDPAAPTFQVLNTAIDSYEAALTNYFEYSYKIDDNIDKLHLCCRAFELGGRDHLSGKVDAHLHIAALAVAMTRLPLPNTFHIDWLVNDEDEKAIFQNALKERLKILKVVSNKSGHVPQKKESYKWIRNDQSSESRFDRFLITQDTLSAVYQRGYFYKGEQVGLRHFRYMKKHTHIEEGDFGDKLNLKPITQYPTKFYFLPGANLMEIALLCARQGRRVCAVNAASAYHCGGGALTGGRHAMEEAWCTQSTLLHGMRGVFIQGYGGAKKYFIEKKLADDHKLTFAGAHIPKNSCIVSPLVEVFRDSDEKGYAFSEQPGILQGVVSVGMPNKNPKMMDAPVDAPKDEGEYEDLVKDKLYGILQAAAKMQSEILMIPDVGCGVYGNDPEVIGRLLGETFIKFKIKNPGLLKCVFVFGGIKFTHMMSKSAEIFDVDKHGNFSDAHAGDKVDYAPGILEFLPSLGNIVNFEDIDQEVDQDDDEHGQLDAGHEILVGSKMDAGQSIFGSEMDAGQSIFGSHDSRHYHPDGNADDLSASQHHRRHRSQSRGGKGKGKNRKGKGNDFNKSQDGKGNGLNQSQAKGKGRGPGGDEPPRGRDEKKKGLCCFGG